MNKYYLFLTRLRHTPRYLSESQKELISKALKGSRRAWREIALAETKHNNL